MYIIPFKNENIVYCFMYLFEKKTMSFWMVLEPRDTQAPQFFQQHLWLANKLLF